MSEALYICIDCELASRSDEPTALNEHSLCPRCGSSSVVPVDTLRELDAQRKREANAQPSVGEDHRKRVEAMRFQRLKDSQPLREWLTSVRHGCGNSKAELLNALTKWDGWAWHVHYPWGQYETQGGFINDDNPAPGHFVVELVQGVKNGPRWVIILDSEVVEVRSFQDGTS
jgi:hypothetical protein